MQKKKRDRCVIKVGTELCVCVSHTYLTSNIVEDSLCFYQLLLHGVQAHVKEHLHPVDLLLHQTAAAGRLVRDAH